ncbi:hypothetical protein NDU88_004036 [Pleurodeles waltl]|uniref:Uncharacterized protein n=1 Tax=Pleurodeles waltl TaxID=8319 RepID=A0AAV7T725_PLEWA|nr:hypothetical protein NDU88_004036 [Pleurodeles waltl]
MSRQALARSQAPIIQTHTSPLGKRSISPILRRHTGKNCHGHRRLEHGEGAFRSALAVAISLTFFSANKTSVAVAPMSSQGR